jgi:hypothetical protein
MLVFLDESHLDEEISWDSLSTWVERKLKGISHGEVDHLISRAKKISSYKEKRELQDRVKEAIDAAEKVRTNGDSKAKREAGLQLEILHKVKSTVDSYDPEKQNEDRQKEKEDEKKKEDDGEGQERRHVVDVKDT